jgi:DMSO/TMAO reductase YedYZ molybdopterin-dependent catalytic subunit
VARRRFGKPAVSCRVCAVVLGCIVCVVFCPAEGRQKLTGTTPYNAIIMMDPKDVDPGDLPLTSVTALHATGKPQVVSEYRWRLIVDGAGVSNPLSLSLHELSQLPTVKKRIILICPGFFFDYVEWEGVPLEALLLEAGAGEEYAKAAFTSVDGYTSTFTKDEIRTHLLVVALRANGVPLPLEHGFPARLVAEDIFGGRWVKYLARIELK